MQQTRALWQRATRRVGSRNVPSVHRRLSSASSASGPPTEEYNEPGGVLFPETLDKDGRRVRQSWEWITYVGFGTATLLLTVGLWNKPESLRLKKPPVRTPFSGTVDKNEPRDEREKAVAE
ncbi:hypothetical protein CDCA_CDCA05G1487 [Cyanidium caldarium]|uniref:Uncharacterized protein n=1 Tax=Cyanidium caldarium TaxID=2771 RepID=A0AAV9IT76_CYACA|nr:hypothetical protein CDCA_CDCA05G1487 [Cyanidium caldarium]